jgi:hypothetical protein
MSEERKDKLSFERQGDNGMGIEIQGSADTLRSMIHSALMNHKDLRTLIMPVILQLMSDNEFRNLCVNDMINDMASNLGVDTEEDNDPLITD